MLILFLSGILIYVILLPTNNNNSYYKKRQKEEAIQSENTDTGNAMNSTNCGNNYQKQLEKELEDFLACVEGVGKVKVLIYTNTSEEYVIEKDQPVYETSREGNDEKSSESKREETTVYTTNEYGDQVPFVTQTRNPSIEGIVIAAQGAADESVRVQLVRMAMALFGVEANKVEVLILKE